MMNGEKYRGHKLMKMNENDGSPWFTTRFRNTQRLENSNRWSQVFCALYVFPPCFAIFVVYFREQKRWWCPAFFFWGGISCSAPYQTFRLEWCLLNVDWANCLSLWGQATDQAGFMQTLLALTHSGAFQPRNAGLCLLLFWTPTWKQQRRPFGDSSLVRCILLLCSSCALT